MSSIWDRVSNVHYTQLIPGNDPTASSASAAPPPDLGIYEDDESRAQAQANAQPLEYPDFLSFLPTLTWRERILGCATCMICGYLLGFGSFMRMKSLLGGNPVPLVMNVTIGNILALCGTCFLTGPTQQFQRMWHPTRKLASGMYLGSLAFTLFLLVVMGKFRGKGFLLFLTLCFQYVAITWYSLTYIPFARDILKSLGRRYLPSVFARGGGSYDGLADDDYIVDA